MSKRMKKKPKRRSYRDRKITMLWKIYYELRLYNEKKLAKIVRARIYAFASKKVRET